MATSSFPEYSRESSVRRNRVTTRTTGKLLATTGYVVGIEISGSGSRQTVALADLAGNVLQIADRPLDYVPDTQSVLKLINEMLDEITAPEHLQNGRILRVGVAIGGLVDARQGLVRRLHHVPAWQNFPLQDYMAEKLGVPCIIDNNANATALAEIQYGVLSGEKHGHHTGEQVALYIGLGRGIGGGLVVNGRIYHGASSTAGEIGHMLVKHNGPKCSCGGLGHLETIASAPAIVRQMRALSDGGLQVEKPKHIGPQGEQMTAEQVFRLAAQGSTVAQQVVDEVETHLGIALANIVHLMNPGVIILGGPVAQAGNLLIAPLQAHLDDLCLKEASESVCIVQGQLGTKANIIGAITLALQDV
ncbi:MAG: ROK family protein [Ktedonobacteraceae bacterium]